MQNGKIAERGSHAELVARKGEYFDMIGFDSTRDKSENEEDTSEKKDESVNGMFCLRGNIRLVFSVAV